MNDEAVAWLIGGVIVVVAMLVVAAANRRSSALGERLMRSAKAFGWEDARRIWWNGAIRGRWRGFDVELRRMPRYKGIPERVLMKVKGSAPAALIVKRRTGKFLSKPMTLFGPPLIELYNFAERDQYWIRSDQAMVAEMLFSNAELTTAIAPNLVAAFDELHVDAKGLRIMRAVDDQAVRTRYGRSLHLFSTDLDLIETIAAEEWRLAAAAVGAAGLRATK